MQPLGSTVWIVLRPDDSSFLAGGGEDLEGMEQRRYRHAKEQLHGIGQREDAPVKMELR